jgi:hypothetical protein
MARAPQTLLAAVRRAKREHNLTDLLALSLEAHISFANRLLLAAKLPSAGEVAVHTEVLTRRGRPVDLQVLGRDERGVELARLWSENKVRGRYQPNQLPDYAEDLPARPARRQLITIVDDLSEVPVDEQSPGDPRWHGFTWRQIAVMGWEAGRESAPEADRPVWRHAASQPTAPSSQRILLELLNLLEEEHGVVLKPIGHEHVTAFIHLSETRQTLEELVKSAARMAELDLSDDFYWDDQDGAGVWQGFSTAGTWAEPLEGTIDLEVSSTDHWTSRRIGEPALGVGYSLPGALASALLSADKHAWRSALEAEGFSVRASDDDSWVLVRRTKYLAELIPAAVTLDLQAQLVADWADDALAVLARHDPGVTLPPKRTRKPRRRRSEPEENEE